MMVYFLSILWILDGKPGVYIEEIDTGSTFFVSYENMEIATYTTLQLEFFFTESHKEATILDAKSKWILRE